MVYLRYEPTTNARSIETMSRPSDKYLVKLMADANEPFAEFACDSLDVSNASITYIRTIKQSNTGIMDGVRSLSEMKSNNLEESSHISPTSNTIINFTKKTIRCVRSNVLSVGITI